MRGVYAAFSKKCSNFGLSKPLSNLYTQKLILDENEKGNNYIRHARALGSSKLVIYTKKSLEGNSVSLRTNQFAIPSLRVLESDEQKSLSGVFAVCSCTLLENQCDTMLEKRRRRQKA